MRRVLGLWLLVWAASAVDRSVVYLGSMGGDLYALQ